MINKTIYIYILFFSSFLTSCDQGKIKNSNQCLGEWTLLDDDSHKKSFILKENGKAEFNNLSIKDIAGDEEEQIPKTGIWKLVSYDNYPNNSFLEFWFIRNRDGGGEYGQGGKLVRKKELEVWFTVGDPDNFEWKRFRLVKPYHANEAK